MNDTLRERLKLARERKRVSQRILSERCGLSGKMVGLYERGERMPNIRTVKALCEELDVSADWLLGIKK